MEDDPDVRWRVFCEVCNKWKLEGLETRAEAIVEGEDHVPLCPAPGDRYQFRVQGYRRRRPAKKKAAATR